jgi:hypothetical protein
VRLNGRLSQPQRIVVVVALGVACGAAGAYLVNLGSAGSYGWYAYAPLTSQTIYPPNAGLHGWVRLIIWLVLAVVWALASIRVLRPSSEEPPGN